MAAQAVYRQQQRSSRICNMQPDQACQASRASGDKRGQPSKEAGKAVGSGQKRQALSELKSQKVKHSQREQQAWTQGTDDSDDFA